MFIEKLEVDNARILLSEFPEDIQETLKSHEDVTIDGKYIVAEAHIDATDVISDISDSTIENECEDRDIATDLSDYDTDDLVKELESCGYKINEDTGKECDMPVKSLKHLLCDRYGVNHLTHPMVLLGKLSLELYGLVES